MEAIWEENIKIEKNIALMKEQIFKKIEEFEQNVRNCTNKVETVIKNDVPEIVKPEPKITPIVKMPAKIVAPVKAAPKQQRSGFTIFSEDFTKSPEKYMELIPPELQNETHENIFNKLLASGHRQKFIDLVKKAN